MAAKPELEMFYKGNREPWGVFEQGRLMFRSGCYKNLPGAGVEDWTGGVRWEVRAQSGGTQGGISRGQVSEPCFEASSPLLSPQLPLPLRMTFSMAS